MPALFPPPHKRRRFQADDDFHHGIMEAADNLYLKQNYELLYNQNRRFRILTGTLSARRVRGRPAGEHRPYPDGLPEKGLGKMPRWPWRTICLGQGRHHGAASGPAAGGGRIPQIGGRRAFAHVKNSGLRLRSRFCKPEFFGDCSIFSSLIPFYSARFSRG